MCVTDVLHSVAFQGTFPMFQQILIAHLSVTLLVPRLFFLMISDQIDIHKIVPIHSNFVHSDPLQFVRPFDEYDMIIVSI